MLRLMRTAARRAPIAQYSPAMKRFPALGSRMYSDAKAQQQEEVAEGDKTTGKAETQPESELPPVTAEAYAELRSKYDLKDKESARLKEAYQKSVADFRNLQKTTVNEIQKAKDFALQKFAKDLIDTVDNFDLAMSDLSRLQGPNAETEVVKFVEGIQMVQRVLEQTLQKHGVTKMAPLGEKYDPNEHEALFQLAQPDKEPGTIFHVDRTGFKLNGRVLRAPKVGIVADTE